MACKVFSHMGFLLSVQTLLTLKGFLEKHFIFALGVLSLLHCIPE